MSLCSLIPFLQGSKLRETVLKSKYLNEVRCREKREPSLEAAQAVPLLWGSGGTRFI